LRKKISETGFLGFSKKSLYMNWA